MEPTPLKTYAIRFTGRKVGALGVSETFEAQRYATNPDKAIEALYDQYEHIMQPQVKEIPPPFDAEYLHIAASNDRDTWETIQRHVSGIVSALDRMRDKCARANKEWHDDPDSADHGLYHAPAEAQITGQELMRCAAECALYFMRETPAGREIFDSICLPEQERKAVQS